MFVKNNCSIVGKHNNSWENQCIYMCRLLLSMYKLVSAVQGSKCVASTESYSSRNFQNVQLPSWFTFTCKWCRVLPLCYEYDQSDIPKYTRKGAWWISEITHNGLISCEETSKTCRNKPRSYTVNTGIWAHLSSKSLDKDTYMDRVSGENSSSGVKQCISWQFKGKNICALMGDCIRTWKSHLCTLQQISKKWRAAGEVHRYYLMCMGAKKQKIVLLTDFF